MRLSALTDLVISQVLAEHLPSWLLPLQRLQGGVAFEALRLGYFEKIEALQRPVYLAIEDSLRDLLNFQEAAAARLPMDDAQKEAERLVIEVGQLRSDGLREREAVSRELAERKQQGG